MVKAFCKERMSKRFDIILRHLVSSANKKDGTSYSVIQDGKSLIKAANRSGPSKASMLP